MLRAGGYNGAVVQVLTLAEDCLEGRVRTGYKDVLVEERERPPAPLFANEDEGALGSRTDCVGDVGVGSLEWLVFGCIECVCPRVESSPAEYLEPELDGEGERGETHCEDDEEVLRVADRVAVEGSQRDRQLGAADRPDPE